MKFFDQFKRKYDSNEHPCLSAMKFFRPQLTEWKEQDEYRLTLHCKGESNIGWGSVNELGVFHTFDHRPILAFASAGGALSGVPSYQVQAESLTEAFTVMIDSTERAEVYYNNYPIGYITPDFTAHDLNGVIVLRVRPTFVDSFGTEVSCFAPAHFQFASGANGGFNIPSHINHVLNRETFVERYAMGVSKSFRLHDYERRWMIAMWIFLRTGPWSSNMFPTTWQEQSDWSDFLPEIDIDWD